MIVNIKSIKKCAFCKYWNDPANLAIKPKAPKINLWEYNDRCKNKCLKNGLDMNAGAFCNQYVSKV